MTPERHQQIKRLFLAACELDEEQRAAFLEQACADDPSLRAEVESLLLHHNSQTIISGPPYALQDPGRTLPADQAEPSPATDTDTHPSTTFGDRGRFTLGSVIAERYRIIGLLGRGGMGEVYRADDLKLGQSVALKFLAAARSGDAEWRARFHNEVRLARRVTHPNVNRIHDLAEVGDDLFISMEYVDGEDLASLLRRIGRFPRDKTIEIARQLCAGLAAAHEQGVLHRDLKPANVMIDGRGRVRITDFGIAALTAGEKQKAAGTPAYMAPELFTGARASVQSDIYSLGAVLYELVSGQPAFDRETSPHRRHTATPASLSTFTDDVDPAIERVVLRCLEADPADRPESVYAVMAALPGGDPLAAALAAGETPSPDLVAAARGEESVHPGRSVSFFVAGILGLVAVVLLADRTLFMSVAKPAKSSAVLADRAQQILHALGYDEKAKGQRYGFVAASEPLDGSPADDERQSDTIRGTGSRAVELLFRYVQDEKRVPSPNPMREWGQFYRGPPPAGMKTVHLDAAGQLRQLTVIPDHQIFNDAENAPPDWPKLLELAGLRMDALVAADASFLPPAYADKCVAWRVSSPEAPDTFVLAEAASLRGRILYFKLLERRASDNMAGGSDEAILHIRPQALVTQLQLLFITVVAAVILARRNWRLGRGDQRGANCLAAFILVLMILSWGVEHQHVLDWGIEVGSAAIALATATFFAAVFWLYYLALEPYVRRFWPHTIISWSKILAGRIRDPLVGRDVLVGILFGMALLLLQQSRVLLQSWQDPSTVLPVLPTRPHELRSLVGLNDNLIILFESLALAIWYGMAFLMLMLLFRVALRKPWIATAVFCVAMAAVVALTNPRPDTVLPWLSGGVKAILIAVALTRAGLLAAIVGAFVSSLVKNAPMTTDLAVWYTETTVFAIGLIVLLLVLGLYLSIAKRPFARA
jgi:serine/threonine-protein kinase